MTGRRWILPGNMRFLYADGAPRMDGQRTIQLLPDSEQRTKWNMRDCDAILTILPEGAYVSPGTDIGLQEGEVLGKPMCTVIGMNDVPAAISWIRTLPEETELCIGGPRASEWPEAYEVARCVLESLSKELC